MRDKMTIRGGMCLRYYIPEFPSPGTPHRADAVCQGWRTEKKHTDSFLPV